MVYKAQTKAHSGNVFLKNTPKKCTKFIFFYLKAHSFIKNTPDILVNKHDPKLIPEMNLYPDVAKQM